ncbi:hypothetical protein D3C72_1856220 [compost metagenome]
MPPAPVTAAEPVLKFASSVEVKGRRHSLRPILDVIVSKQVVLVPLTHEDTVEFCVLIVVTNEFTESKSALMLTSSIFK